MNVLSGILGATVLAKFYPFLCIASTIEIDNFRTLSLIMITQDEIKETHCTHVTAYSGYKEIS